MEVRSGPWSSRDTKCFSATEVMCSNEAKAKKDAVIDYESCYEHIWRAGLLHKASKIGINGRMWLYLKNFLWDRSYYMYIRVNDFKSQTFRSTVGISQGSVISPPLCNLYTHNSMEGIEGKHAEYADDTNVWSSHKNIIEAGESVNRDLNLRVKPWCRKWNMSVAADKTDVVVITPDGKDQTNMIDIKLGEEKLKVVKSKKVLGVVIDNQLNFHEHVQERVKAGFRALKSLDSFIKGHKGCC